MDCPNENGLTAPASTRTAWPCSTAGWAVRRSRRSESSCPSSRARPTAVPAAYTASTSAAQLRGAASGPLAAPALGAPGASTTTNATGGPATGGSSAGTGTAGYTAANSSAPTR